MAWQGSISQYIVGALSTNCYMLVDDGSCLVVDPGSQGEQLACEVADVKEIQIVATHGHHDHVCGVAALKRATGASFAISHADAERAQHSLQISSHNFDVSEWGLEDAPEPDRLLREGDVVTVGSYDLRVIEAPGHTEGGIVLLGDGFAFVGDTIFAGSVGRTDLAGGDYKTLMATIQKLKRVIPPDTVLLCGHGPATTMAQEIATNPYF